MEVAAAGQGTTIDKIQKSLKRTRVAVSLFYFGQGIGFASWASRIPDIKHSLDLSDAALGSILLALPAGQLFTMPLSAKLVTKYGSKKMLTITAPLYVVALTNLGLATAPWQLAAFLFLFGVIGNMANIALNTQGVETEKLYNRPINTSFHGAWSVAGFAGALIGLLMVNMHVKPYQHFLVIILLGWTNVLINHKHLVGGKPEGSGTKRPFFIKPEGSLLQLGIIAFCSMATEGAMFDWSGVYFKKVLLVDKTWIGAGYTAFTVSMAMVRFITDWLTHHTGLKKILLYSGILTATGLIVCVSLPYLIPAMIGCVLVGIGVSPAVPLVFSAAGRSKDLSPGVAIAAVSTFGFIGLLIGPPLIGFIAGATSLRISFVILAAVGLVVSVLAFKVKEE